MKRLIFLIVSFITLCSFSLPAQNLPKINEIKEFMEWKLQDFVKESRLICTEPIQIDNETLDCVEEDGILEIIGSAHCGYIGKADVLFMLRQNKEIIRKKLNLKDFCNKSLNLKKCSMLNSEEVIARFSVPLFSKDKKTVLLYSSFCVSNTAIATDYTELYKKDENNKWHLFHTLQIMNTD